MLEPGVTCRSIRPYTVCVKTTGHVYNSLQQCMRPHMTSPSCRHRAGSMLDYLRSPPPRLSCELHKNRKTGKTRSNAHCKCTQLSGIPTVTHLALTIFSSRTMSLLGAVMQAGLMLLSKPRADEFGSPWPERASAAEISAKAKNSAWASGLGGHHDAGARRRHWSHQGRSHARASKTSVDMYGFTRRFAFPSACLCWHKVMPSSTVTWVLDRSP